MDSARQRCLLSLVLQIFASASSVPGPGPDSGPGPGLNQPPPGSPNFAPDNMSTEHIKRNGYPAESHRITTEDGYILTIDRIPPRANTTNDKMPLILLHGMIGNSMQFLVAGTRSGLGYICSDAGFDVWLVNYRGTMFSRDHVKKLKPKEYWDFSFYEQGIHDTLQSIDYILAITKKPRAHILGYSMGASALLIGLTERPEYNEKMQSAILMAPSTQMIHASTPLKKVAPYVDSMQRYLQQLHFYFMPMFDMNVLRPFIRRFCAIPTIGNMICRQFMSIFEGFEIPVKQTLMKKIYNIYPDYFSTKTLLHYFQHMNSGKYCKFDYGSQKNLQIYNSTSPPVFDLSKVNTSVLILCSKKDGFSSLMDNYWLKSQIPRAINLYQIQTNSVFGHLSFTLDSRVDTVVYKHIVTFLNDNS